MSTKVFKKKKHVHRNTSSFPKHIWGDMEDAGKLIALYCTFYHLITFTLHLFAFSIRERNMTIKEWDKNSIRESTIYLSKT